ncbi:MAG: transcriptional regulator PpsR [Pseudomonadota bacterium]
MKPFKSPKRTLGDLDAKIAARLITASSDVALVIDATGKIRDLAFSSEQFANIDATGWPGKQLADVVTSECIPKVEAMLDGIEDDPAREFQVNHPTSGPQDLPVRYQTLRLGSEGPIIAVGRELSLTSSLQQKLISAQSQLDRDYARQIQIETRYQALFRFSGEATLIANAHNKNIVEANQAMVQVFANGSSGITGKKLDDLFAPQSLPELDALLAHVRNSPRSRSISVRLANKGSDYNLTASVFRDQAELYYLVRLESSRGQSDGLQEQLQALRLHSVLAELPDGFVVLDEDLKLVLANRAFLDLVQLATEDQAKEQPISRWLGRVDVDAEVLLASIKNHGSLTRHTAILRGEYDAAQDVEVTGVFITSLDRPVYGLMIRRTVSELASATGEVIAAGAEGVDKLKGLVGHTPLRDVVRQTTDIVERMCIEAALELTGDNRASAAEMLGVSRQSLYMKLRRHQLGGLSEGDG